MSSAATIDSLIMGERLGEGERFSFFRAGDICKIDIWEPKRNYTIPRYHTKSGIFTGVLLTMEDCKDAFPWMFKADVSNLINVELIDHVEESPFALTAHFPYGVTPANIAKYKKRFVQHLITKA